MTKTATTMTPVMIMPERSEFSFINTVFGAATTHKIINIQMSDPPPPQSAVHSRESDYELSVIYDDFLGGRLDIREILFLGFYYNCE